MANESQYSLLEIQKENVISNIASKRYTVYAVEITTGKQTVVNTELTIAQLQDMVATKDYLYFIIRKKAES